MNQAIAEGLSRFTPISLAALNGKAAMLDRLDNKYIVPIARVLPALGALAGHFDVLEIGGKRAFTYATRYFDDGERRGYWDHHQGRRKRCKVRVRHYVDAGLCFLEVKLKDHRDVTVKKRLQVDAQVDTLDRRCLDFIDACHRDLYDEGFDRPLRPVIGMTYHRITLVAAAGGERMTIDTGIEFLAGDRSCSVSPDIFIVETKSARGNGIADKILRELHQHPTSRCSKYCIGVAALGQVAKHNKFLPALRRLRLVDVPSAS